MTPKRLTGIDMTHGKIVRQLIFFSLPLMFGHFLQQTYTAIDAVVVGRFVSSEALAAVGSTGPLVNTLIAFFVGMSSGCSVMIARYYGAKNSFELRNTLHTSVLLAIFMGVVISAAGVLFSPALLRLMQTPESVYGDAVVYLRVYFSGTLTLTIYNMGAAILTATGDSKRPLYFLIFSFIINMIIKFIFVLGFGMGVAGVAWSTVISQSLCAVLILLLLSKSRMDIRLDFKQLKIHWHILKQVMKIGIPSGIQTSIISGSNIIVQSYINRLGAVVAAGYSAGTRLDGYVMIPIHGMNAAASTFVAQNLGAAP